MTTSLIAAVDMPRDVGNPVVVGHQTLENESGLKNSMTVEL